jgi:hypothetical protein
MRVCTMDAVERFVAEENIWRLIDSFANRPEPDERLVLAHILLQEEDKFAQEVERFEMVQGWIDRCDGHIARHNALLDGASDGDGARMRNVVHSMEEIRHTLVSLQMTWKVNMDDAAKFAGKS